MDIIQRLIFKRVGLKLPANAKDMLRVGSLRIYDIIELLVNTINAVVRANDENIDKEERFLVRLSEAINTWASDFEGSIQKLIKEGVFDEMTLAGGSVTADKLADDALAAMFKSIELLAPHDEGNTYTNELGYTGTEYVLAFTDMKDNVSFVSLQPIIGGSSTSVIDIASRMVNGGFIQSTELDSNVFVYDGFPIAGAAHAMNEDADERYLLFKVCTTDTFNNAVKYIAFKARTVSIPTSVGYYFDYDRIIDEDDEDYGWAMNVFRDVIIDTDSHILTAGGVNYQLTPYTSSETTTWQYGTPVITSVSYDDIPGGGGYVSPVINFTQQVTKVVTNSSGTTNTNYTLEGTYKKNSGGSMAFTYNNSSIVHSASQVSFEDVGQTTLSNAAVTNVGNVTAESTESTTRQKVITVGITILVNGEESEPFEKDVYQKAATAKGYYGSSDDIPTTIGEASGNFNIGNTTITVNEPGMIIWIAVPTGSVSSVVGRDLDGTGDIVELETDTTTISGYTIYYLSLGIEANGARFDITT